ncbi:MAG: chorismate mutase family protein [Caldilineaceae bacterium]|nr:chorismate mutase family protein [Caldilineaceae bacterium]
MKAPADCQSIDEVRSEIDRVDHAIVELLGERRRYVQAIMRFKRNEGDVRAPARQAQVIADRRRWAEDVELNPDLVEEIYRTIIDHFVAEEMRLLAEHNRS